MIRVASFVTVCSGQSKKRIRFCSKEDFRSSLLSGCLEARVMPFSLRNFLRQVPIGTLKAYLEQKSAPIPSEWWGHKPPKLVKRVAEQLVSTTDEVSEAILGDFVRIHPMVSERGRNAFTNAAARNEQFLDEFGRLENDHDRAVWVFLRHNQIFREAEEIRFFDYYSEGDRARHFRTTPDLSVSRDPSDMEAFKTDLRTFHRRRDGSGVSCEIEFAERCTDDSVQIAIYVQGLPNNATEFVAGTFVRRISSPALEAAIVYEPRTGNTTTVARGGKDVHEALREAFALKLLKVDPKFDMVRRRGFQLDGLKVPTTLAPDPALGVDAVRVRKLKLAPPAFGTGTLTIEAPSGEPHISVYDLANAWFSERSQVYRRFTVVHATISMHFHCSKGSRKAKTLNIELTKPNSSNLKDLSERDRKVAEAHIERWQLMEPAASGG